MAADKKRKIKDTTGISPDPYLRSFLRQAVAIIASEKGLTESSQAKLKKIASELGLTDAAFRDAMDQLKTPGNSLGLNRYEQKFVERISRELENFHGDLLSIRYEKRLAEVAENKYQIPPVRAHQLIQKTAQQHNIGIISHSDAQQFVQTLVEDSVGKRPHVPDAEIQRLIQVGEKWGISPEKTKNQISALTLKNRRRRQAARAKRYAMYSVGVASAILVSWVVQRFDWSGLLASNNNVPVVDEATPEPSNPRYPDWWNTSMIDSLERMPNAVQLQIRSTMETQEATNLNLVDVYRSILNTAAGKNRDSLADEFLSQSFFRDPNSNAALVIPQRLKEMLLNDDEMPFTPSRIRRIKRAAEMATQLATQNPPADGVDSRSTIAGDLIRAIDDSLDPELSAQELLVRAQSSLALKTWTNLFRQSQSNPRSIAACIGEIEKISADDRPDFNELRLRTCQSVIAADVVQWNTIRPSIQKSIESASPANLKTWIKMALDTKQPNNLRQFLANQLAGRLDLPQTGSSAIYQQLTEFVRKANGKNGSRHLGNIAVVASRIRESDKRLQRANILNNPNAIQALETEKIPELALALAEINNDILLLLEDHPDSSQLENRESKINRLAQANFPMKLSATASQKRRLKEAIERLKDRDQNKLFRRIGAIEKIRGLAKHFSTLNQESAHELADYVLSSLSPQEQSAIDRALPDFERWVRFKLSIADQLNQSSLSKNEIIDLVKRLKIEIADLSTQSNWQTRIRNAIVKDCHQSLVKKESQSPESLLWSQFHLFYTDNFKKRMMWLAGTNQQVARNQNWILALERGLQESHRPRVMHQVRLLESESNPICQLSLANHLVADFFAEQFDFDSNRPKPNLEVEFTTGGQALLESEWQLYFVLRQAFTNQYIESGDS